MKLLANQTGEASLRKIGDEAVQLVRAGEVEALVQRFGYAVALGREPVSAVEADLSSSLAEIGAARLLPDGPYSSAVTYFKPNTSGLFALVECVVPADVGGAVLIELVITSQDEEKYVSLEQLSAAT